MNYIVCVVAHHNKKSIQKKNVFVVRGDETDGRFYEDNINFLVDFHMRNGPTNSKKDVI